MPQRELLTPAEYAKKNGIDRATVYRRINAGKLPFILQRKTVIRIPADATEVAEVKAK